MSLGEDLKNPVIRMDDDNQAHRKIIHKIILWEFLHCPRRPR